MKQFESILEGYMERYTTGGFVTGDLIKFKPNALTATTLKDKPETFKFRIKDFMKSDLNLKVASVKRTIDAFSGEEAEEIDIVREYAPGLWADPMTVPIDAIEFVDTGANAFQHPVPKSLKRPNRLNGPEELKAKQTADKVKTDVNLPTGNTKIPGGKKWNDSKPGGGNLPKKNSF